jgi:hypothetical protein
VTGRRAIDDEHVAAVEREVHDGHVVCGLDDQLLDDGHPRCHHDHRAGNAPVQDPLVEAANLGPGGAQDLDHALVSGSTRDVDEHPTLLDSRSAAASLMNDWIEKMIPER